MIPSVVSPEVTSSAEQKVFEWFKTADNTDNWIVLHSLGISNHNKVIYGETDFLVIAPKLGIFALEVKGGRVKREDGIWFFTNRYGETNSKPRGPFEQAKDGIFSILNSLKKRLDNNHSHISDILYGYGVMFPDVEYTAQGIDEEQWQIFDSRDGNNITEFIERLSKSTIEKWKSLYGSFDDSKLPSIKDVKYISSLLRGDFDFAVSINSQFITAKNELISLTKEQYRCLDQLDDNPRCLIMGPAGTGKTLIAIEEAKKRSASGERVALFCFNSNLADWISSYYDSFPLSLRPSFIGTFHKYMVQITNDTHTRPPMPQNESSKDEYYKELLPNASLKALEECQERFDRIIIDEAQDLINDNYLIVLDSCLKKGLDRGKWTMFGDFSMQAIYNTNHSEKELIDKLADYSYFIRFKLTVNCRNTKPICKELQTITGFDPSNNLWTKVDGPPVQYITWNSMDEQKEKLEQLLTDLYNSHVKPQSITILSPKRREDSVVSSLKKYSVRNYRISERIRTMFCTIQGYKGLENTIIILTDIESYSSEQLMYAGLSRACSGLFILESNSAKKEYDDLLRRRLLK